MDSFVLKKVIDELRVILPGSLVSKIYQPGKRELSFELWKPGGGFRLFISAHPLFCSVHITDHDLENPPLPPRFCQALRKHLSGKRVRAIELTDFERAFSITFGSKGTGGDDPNLTLVTELFGRHANIILLDKGGVIINALNIVTEDDTRVRQVTSGTPYRPLPPLPKTFFPSVTTETCRQILIDSWDDLQSAIMRNIHGVSRDVMSQISAEVDTGPERLLSEFEGLIHAYRTGAYRVGIGRGKKDGITLLPVINAERIPERIEFFDSALTAADSFFHFSYTREQFLSLKNKLLMAIGKRKKKEDRKRKRIEGDIVKLEAFKEMGRKGELLKGCLHSIKKGQRECVALDYSQTPPEEVLIELDPSLLPVENMNRYFRLYKKGQRGIAMKGRLLPRIGDEIGYLDTMRYYAEKAKTIDELVLLEAEMVESGLLRQKVRKKRKEKRKRIKDPVAIHVEKLAVGEFSVYIGKNNRGNDHIVKILAAPGDVWLHARHHPGSHVLIKGRKKNDEIPEEIIYRSGQIAAARSGGARAGKVEVFVADAKDVSKIPGQKPGVVRIKRYRTIMVETENHSS